MPGEITTAEYRALAELRYLRQDYAGAWDEVKKARAAGIEPKASFMIALKRSALGAILLLAPKRFSIHVRASAEEALLDDPPKPVRFDARRAINELRRRRLVT